MRSSVLLHTLRYCDSKNNILIPVIYHLKLTGMCECDHKRPVDFSCQGIFYRLHRVDSADG